MKNIYMTDANDPASIIKITQEALIDSMIITLDSIKSDIKCEGLTFDQIKFFLETYKKKIPTIINQLDEM